MTRGFQLARSWSLVFVATAACIADLDGRPPSAQVATARDVTPMQICEDAHAPAAEPIER
jgi:hypothetical protein